MASKHMTRCATSLVISEMQMKTTMRYHGTLARMAIMKRQIITPDGEDAETLEPSHAAGGNLKWCSFFGRVRQFLKRLNIELP